MIALKEIASNRKARHDFEILETLEAGIELKGTEVKSIRAGRVNVRDAFARVEKGELILYGVDIQPYENASYDQHVSKRPRRLLVHKRELNRLQALTAERGHTLVALKLYWKGQRVKVELAAGKGKAKGDRREDLKKRVETREAERAVANFNRR